MDAMLVGILLFVLFLLCGIKSIILKKRENLHLYNKCSV